MVTHEDIWLLHRIGAPVLSPEGRLARRLTNVPGGATSPKFRPDGQAILFQTTFVAGATSLDDNRTRLDEVKARKDTARAYDSFPMRFWNAWLEPREPVLAWQKLDEGTPTILPVAPLRGPFDGGGGESLHAIWTPDGQGVVFQAIANRHRGMIESPEPALYLLAATGGSPKRLTPPGTGFARPEFSPDGQALYAIESRRSSPSQLFFVNRLARLTGPDWSRVVLVTQGWDRSVGNIAVSDDGRSLYVEAEDDGSTKVFRFRATGGPPEVVYAPESGAVTDLQLANGVLVGRFSASTNPGQIVRLDSGAKTATPLTSFNRERLAYPQIDLTRQAAIGASYGGYLMNWFNGTTTQFKALVNHAGAVNNESQYGVNDGGIDRELRMGAPIWETGKGQWFDQSPIRFAKAWKTPMLVTQGELDFRVPISESLTTFKLLQRLEVPSRLVVFPDEGHWILKGPNGKRHMDEVLGWLKKYL